MDDYSSIILSIVREAGQIALELLGKSHPKLKPDNSVITEADTRISTLVHEKLALCLAKDDHVLIDEEDAQRGEHFDRVFSGHVPYVWSIDPIDATRAYANRMPHYGISLGLIKDLRPWLGAVYFPSLKELFYCDGNDAFFVENSFSSQEKRTRIVPIDEQISNRSVLIATDELPKLFEWQSTDCRLMIFSAAVCEFCWPAIGRGCGSLSRVHLWDMAGSWPIAEKAGLKFYSYDSGRPLEKLEANDFERTWRLKGYQILSSARNFPILKDMIVRKGMTA